MPSAANGSVHAAGGNLLSPIGWKSRNPLAVPSWKVFHSRFLPALRFSRILPQAAKARAAAKGSR
jgi:hypothetical protein